jgi:hypothetical protein
VHRPMMQAAQRHEIRQPGLAAFAPLVNVVTV